MQMAMATSSTLQSPTLVQAGFDARYSISSFPGDDSAVLGSFKPRGETLRSIIDTPKKTPHKPDNASSSKTPEQKWTPKSSLSLRSRHKASPQSCTARPRGTTLPLEPRPSSSRSEHDAWTPERNRKRDKDTDSVLSFTPSMSGKNLANWLSGLLGRQ